MINGKSTCVLLATYNEADNIGQILDLLNNKHNLDVVIVDDNSPDGTAAIARKYPKTRVVVRVGKKGIASAYIDGFKYINENFHYDYVVQMDAGMTHDPDDVVKMVEYAIEKDADLVIGSRDIKHQKIISYRTVLSKTAVLLMRMVGIKQNDVTSGFRCWRSGLLRRLWFDFVTSKGFGFQIEMLYMTKFLDAKIEEYKIPYKLTNSSLNRKIIIEAFLIWCRLFFYVQGTDHDLMLEKHYNIKKW